MDQALLRAVVQIADDPPALVVGRRGDARARGGELSARLQVGDRGRHQLREVGEPALHAGRERALARGGRDRAPELALDDDRTRERGADPLRPDDLGHARGRRVVGVESCGPPGPVDLGDDEVRIQLEARAHRVPGGVGSHDGHRAVGLETDHGGGVRPGERLDLVAHRTEERVRRHALRDQRRHAPQRRLLVGEHRLAPLVTRRWRSPSLRAR